MPNWTPELFSALDADRALLARFDEISALHRGNPDDPKLNLFQAAICQLILDAGYPPIDFPQEHPDSGRFCMSANGKMIPVPRAITLRMLEGVAEDKGFTGGDWRGQVMNYLVGNSDIVGKKP